jgi:hypothetical protein
MAKLLGSFEASGIELLGFFGVEVAGGLDQDHFLVADADAAVESAARVGATEIARRDVLVTAAAGLGAVADVLRRIAEHGVSIDMIYRTFDGELVVGIEGDDVDRAIAAIDG